MPGARRSLLPLLLLGLSCIPVWCQEGGNGTSASIDDDRASALIVGGRPAQVDRHPYAAQVIWVRKSGVARCTGTLITRSVVLTAGHCIGVKGTYYLKIGAYNTVLDDAYHRPWALRKAVKVATAPGFDRTNENVQPDDVALLLLDRPVTKMPIRLVAANAPEMRAGRLLSVIGWGATDATGSSGTSNTLKRVEQRTVTRAMCNEAYQATLNERTMCARIKKGAGICMGDSGGPLFVEGKGPHDDVLVGVTSFGGRLCANGNPVGYVRVAKQRRWIEKTVKSWGEKLRQ